MADPSAAAPLPSPAAPGQAPRRPLTRREMLLGLAAGGAALVTTNTATAATTGRVATSLANRRAQVTIDELEAEISRLQRQLALYRDLERIGLDRLVRTALETYDRLWPPVRAGIRLLLGAVQSLEEKLQHFELKLPTLRSASRVLGNLLAGVEAQLEGVRETINEVLKRSGAIGEAVSGFLAWLMGKIPFGVGAQVREAADRLSALVATVPALIADTRRRLLGPLDEEWLATAPEAGLQGRLFEPLRETLLTPLRGHLEQVDEMASNWEEETAAPLRAALTRRDKIRREIARLEEAPDGPGGRSALRSP